MSNENNINNDNQELIMGKYKTVGDLESAYKELKNSYDGLAQNKNNFTVPEQYSNSESMALLDSDLLKNASEKARSRNYSQSQYENLVNREIEKAKNKQESLQLKKDKYGDKLENLSSYMEERLGLSKKFVDGLDEDDIDKLLEFRENELSTNTDLNVGSIVGSVSKDDLHTEYKKAEECRAYGDMVGFEYHLNRYMEISNKLKG